MSKEKQVKAHDDIAATIAANAITKARKGENVLSQNSSDHVDPHRIVKPAFLAGFALAISVWSALGWWLPGLVSVPAAISGAFWSCVLLAGCWYYLDQCFETN